MASDPQSVLVLLYHDKPGNVGNPFYPQSLGSQVGHFSGHPDYASSGNWG